MRLAILGDDLSEGGLLLSLLLSGLLTACGRRERKHGNYSALFGSVGKVFVGGVGMCNIVFSAFGKTLSGKNPWFGAPQNLSSLRYAPQMLPL